MNRNLLKIAKAASGFALALTIVSCNSGEKGTTKEAGSQTKIEKRETEQIVYVNSDSLLNNYEYFKSLKEKFEAKSKKAEAELKNKGAAFQREVAAYQQSAQTMSADQRAQTEERLARKQQELQTYQQNAGSALAHEEAAENEKLYDKVADYLKKHAKEKGYKMVLTYSKGNSAILFADDNLDVTKDVIKGLNEEYKKEQK
ncbi:outer membrane chaperone Skp (OmpH) [Pseudopedobacter saltans DSM 12145]|uniref:Outer membrane chaperone Skp (OmpH) n=1 Tax=Pseudopedobacter saltans (strain ATCC 51119 / DSM 12145 / JCM 21818 / CCUG 39354 / LMG 10337 / NBRC 100064 / NCIMB 13643) TaxID=762903 RepID=F0SCG8_PSESL|nr:OmpH family outer membrane protein [Pseudopedobacter saltans]ADY52802.1 outer membrane chaperone Skp (OmpH) [Pseudopedobacter saltans DSM 12145]